MPLSNNSQSPLSSAPLNPLLPPNRHPNGYLDKYSNSNIDYLNNKLNSDTIKALQPSSNKPSPTRG
jgi:superoxide dismutase